MQPIASFITSTKHFCETHPTLATLTGISAQVLAWTLKNYLAVAAGVSAIGGAVVVTYTAMWKIYVWKHRKELLAKKLNEETKL